MEFDGSFGTAHADGSANNEYMDILDAHGKLVSTDSGELLNAYPSGRNPIASDFTDVVALEAVSAADARRQIGAKRAYATPYTAKVVTTGVAGPVPGSAIAVDGFDSEFDGLWLVRGMDMKTNRGNFVARYK